MPDYLRNFIPGGTYFFTVVTYGRYRFIESELARTLLRTAWQAIQSEMPFTNVASVLLPEHFHCLWALPRGDSNFSLRLKKLKDSFTSSWLEAGGYEVPVTPSQKKHGNRGIWQRRFWEHTIRDVDDLENHFDYIHYNPVKHGLVTRPLDWPHSTFHRYVASGHYSQDWGRQSLSHLSDMDFE